MRFLAAIVILLLALPAHAQSLSQALVVSSCGAPTLTIGGQVQMTMDTTGRLCSHKTGSGVSPPVISVAPVASGSLTVGSTLSCTTGTWTNSPTSYAYTWLRGGSTISGATSATYVTVSADGGTSVGCSVIASNAGGASSPSASNTLAIAAAGGCSQATAYLARATGETTHAADLTTLICGLVTDGVWVKLDALYIMAQQTETDAKLNLVSTSFSLVQTGALGGLLRPLPQTGSIVFTQYRGFAGFSTANAYFDTNFTATTAPSPQYTQNSASFGSWTNGAASENSAEIGNSSAGNSGEAHIYNNFTGGLFYARVNNNSVGSVPSPGTAGLYVGDRPSSSTVVPYYNGVAQTSQASTSQALYAGDFRIGFVSTAASSQQFAEAHIAASLGALNLAFYNRLRTYMTAIGVP